jgi:hypothetical protein
LFDERVSVVTTQPELEIGPDLAVWLTGPPAGADEADRTRWAAEAQYALASDFDLENAPDGVASRAYLARILQAFAAWPTPADLTFLRLRSADDTPMPLGLELYTRDDVLALCDELGEWPAADELPHTWFADRMSSFGAGVPTPAEVSDEPVDGAAGWRRVVLWLEEDGVLTSRVRYTRAYEASGVVAVLRWGGLDPAETIDAILDVDDLVRTIRVGGEA